MLPRNGICLYFAIVIFCITLSYANHMEEDMNEEEQGKIIVDISKLQVPSPPSPPSKPNRRKPSKPRPEYYYPPTSYWPPPQQPPPFYGYPPNQNDEWKPPKGEPSRPKCLRPTKQNNAYRKFCEDDGEDLPMCDKICEYFPNLRICSPFCSLSPPITGYCEAECLLSATAPGCSTRPLITDAESVAIRDACTANANDMDCEIYCNEFPRPREPWCSQRRLIG